LINVLHNIKQIYIKYETWIKIITFAYFIFDHFTFKWFTPLWNLIVPYLYTMWQKPIIDWSFQTFIIAIFIQLVIIMTAVKYIPRRNKTSGIVSTEKVIPLTEPKKIINEISVTPKEIQRKKHSEEFVKYLDVKWRIVDGEIERAHYCPIHEAKLIPSKTMNGGYSCPIEKCACKPYLPLDDATFEKVNSAIPAILKINEKKRLRDMVSVMRDNKYVEHADVLWEYEKRTGELNVDPLCPIDRTPLLFYEYNKINVGDSPSAFVVGAIMQSSSNYYCPKCKNKYLIGKSMVAMERIRTEVKAIIKGENK